VSVIIHIKQLTNKKHLTMKKTIKLLSVVFAMGIFMTSCEKDVEQVGTATPEPAAQTITDDWETTDPTVINSINNKIEENLKSGKLSTQVYRNFRLQVDGRTPQDIIALIKKEIDQMYVSGLKTSTLSKMDDVRAIYLANTGEDVGLYYYNSLVVINDYATFRRVKQSASGVVPHELTHYYHDRFISGGFGNSTVRSLHASAKSRRAYPASAYVLRNSAEYLATSAEAYFSGTSRDPYNRATVGQKDPNLRNFISTNF
jgi:hypothetical protein